MDRCSIIDCDNKARFNLENTVLPNYCKKHKDIGMQYK